jgi:hypothetical protein
MKSIRIGCGQGFWGDDIDAPARLVNTGALDYLVMDFLAEITMSIMQKQRAKNPELGYARDVLPILRQILPEAVRHGVKVVTNAGGVNPESCARAIQGVANELGLGDDVRIGVVLGDDLLPDIHDLSQSNSLENMDTSEPFESVSDRVVSANAYLGSGQIVGALRDGANVVICGRVTDTALTLAPAMHEFAWDSTDWDRLAGGLVAGHVIECSAQVSGGNHQAAWEDVPDLFEVGYPIVEISEDGSAVVTKPTNSGGLVNAETVTEQLLYEIGDPKAVLTPDVTVDWTSFTLEEVGNDRVRISGARGAPPPRR